MSLVVFPFKDEDLAVVTANLEVGARHERVDEVWAVAAAEGSALAGVVAAARDVEAASNKSIKVFSQERIGSMRPGKGDGMNTALAMSAESGFGRTHFYDADITNFDRRWIDAAESAADRGYSVVRHRFPRAATDAMITWMITRPGLAMIFPGTMLPRIGQPLGGEILLTDDVVEHLASNTFVRRRSDWGIDTLITHATSVLDAPTYETNVPDGKRHALYGSLTDIGEMLLECLDAVASLRGQQPPATGAAFDADPVSDVPEDLKQTVGYDIAATRAAIAAPPVDGEADVLSSMNIDPDVPGRIDEARWGQILERLLESFDLDDSAWRRAAFRLWVQRVITYTTEIVPHGYDHAMTYLEDTIRDYESRGLG